MTEDKTHYKIKLQATKEKLTVDEFLIKIFDRYMNKKHDK